MGLTKAQATMWQKARSLGSGSQAIDLTDECCAYLVGRIIQDLGLVDQFPEFDFKKPALRHSCWTTPVSGKALAAGHAGNHRLTSYNFQQEWRRAKKPLPSFFSSEPLENLVVTGLDGKALFERLVTSQADADTYFACLASMHKARLKYERILSTQPLPTLEQVGPRGLLQFGKLDSDALAGFLFWRKWFYDIDNRAAQETGYLFEPIIAHAIGGTPAPAKKSPVKRQSDRSKGRQVDCLLDDRAYEFKIRVTIAASGQGRWQEELDFPADCRASGFTPVLVCLDSTPNPKIDSLIRAFLAHQGEVFIGDAAWQHLDSVAGKTMTSFLERYVRVPLQSLLDKAPNTPPPLTAHWNETSIDIRVGNAAFQIPRHEPTAEEETDDEMPDDAAEDVTDG